jgi:hypothetical protein
MLLSFGRTTANTEIETSGHERPPATAMDRPNVRLADSARSPVIEHPPSDP